MKRGHAAAFAREQLERRLKSWRRSNGKAPERGWIRAIREGLGMSARQLAQKLKISQPAVTALEKAEIAGTIRLGTLQKAAKAMGCCVYYIIAPTGNRSFAEVVRSRAFSVAVLESLMSLRRSGIDARGRVLKEFIDIRARSIAPHLLWEDEVLDQQFEDLKKLASAPKPTVAPAPAANEPENDEGDEVYTGERLREFLARPPPEKKW